MTDEERKQEDAEDIEDLEAPAANQSDVIGGAAAKCISPTCPVHPPNATHVGCKDKSTEVVIYPYR